MNVGESLPRVEDRPLLVGEARFVDDVPLEGGLEAAFVRSPIAHGHLIDAGVDPARRMPQVEAVFTSLDLALDPLVPSSTHPDISSVEQPVLAKNKVRFAGEPIAIVVARNRYVAEDARDAAVPEIDELEALTDPNRAIADDAPEIHDGLRNNTVVDTQWDAGDVDAAFAQADVVIERTIRSPRQSAMPIEGRAVLAVPEGSGLRVWTSSQVPHKVRQAICEILGLTSEQVRVITPAIGGGFGVKAHVYPEEIVLAATALRLGRAVKWVEDRAENLMASTQARKQELKVRAAMTTDGELLALDSDILCDQGAYGAYPHGVSIEAFTTAGMLPGPYRLPNYRVRARAAVTNTSPEGAYRGVGFVVATFAHERIIDTLARAAQLDPADVRRKNLVRAHEMPYFSITQQPYDSGDYVQALDTAVDAIRDSDLPERSAEASRNGRRTGVGIACYVEPTAMNSDVYKRRGMTGVEGFDAAHVSLDPGGHVRIWTTTPAIGQGTATTVAQLAADYLETDPSLVQVKDCDTGAAELRGTGTFASRGAASAGGAVIGACKTIRERLMEAAAEQLEAAAGDLEIADGSIRVAGSPEVVVSIRELVAAAPEHFRVSHTFDPPQTVYPYATHACLVSVDPDTGEVSLDRYVIVEDCGRMINPMIVAGQVHGATAQGVGGALYEAHDYDDIGQLRTASLLDYVVPTAAEMPNLELSHLEMPSPTTESGVKGVGEGGAIAPAAAIANAIGDALGVEFNEFPITPEQIASCESARVLRSPTKDSSRVAPR